MPRWLMKTSVPVGVRSTRVRKRSRSLVEYSESKTLPRVRRMKYCGSLARFSPHAVSITPISALSVDKAKPRPCQNWRN